MNSIKLIAKSLDNLYPKSYSMPPIDDDLPEEYAAKEESLEPESPPPQAPPAAARSSWLNSLAYAVFFLPNYLILKPVLFVWLLFTYPFAYFFEQLGLTKTYQDAESAEPTEALAYEEDDKSDDDRASLDTLIRTSIDTPTPKSLSFAESPRKIRTNVSGIDEKTELLKQENIIANTIKSPTASSKYIIPPPQRLYPLSRNPHKKRRKTLILDLDETLIHSLSRGSPRSFNSSSASAPKVIEVKLHNMASLYYVHKRPFCDFFLKEISKWFELQIFTASVKEYADPIIDWLENDMIDHRKAHEQQKGHSRMVDASPPRIFTKRYYRSDCTYREGVGYIKDLSRFFPKEEELKNVIILDNSPVSYALHEDNAVMIEGWINDQSDRDLLNLLPMLHSLSLCIDVRFILGLREGEKMFEN